MPIVTMGDATKRRGESSSVGVVVEESRRSWWSLLVDADDGSRALPRRRAAPGGRLVRDEGAELGLGGRDRVC